MQANGDKPMAEVVQLILAAQHDAGFTDVTAKICEGAYRWAVRKAVAPGSVPEKAPKAARAPKAAKPKAIKTKAQAVKAVAKPTGPQKSAAELEAIRAANLARIKEVASRMGVLKPKSEVVAAQARDEDEDNRDYPAFLTKSEVEALV
jgi:hypothetical protein